MAVVAAGYLHAVAVLEDDSNQKQKHIRFYSQQKVKPPCALTAPPCETRVGCFLGRKIFRRTREKFSHAFGDPLGELVLAFIIHLHVLRIQVRGSCVQVCRHRGFESKFWDSKRERSMVSFDSIPMPAQIVVSVGHNKNFNRWV